MLFSYSHTYVRLDEIATKISFEVAEGVAKDMFDCSQDLYNSVANPRYSPFPFSPSQRLPVDLSATSVYEYDGGSRGSYSDDFANVLDNNPNTMWRARKNVFGPTSKIISKKSSRCMHWDDGAGKNTVNTQTCQGMGNQLWYYEIGTKLIRSAHKANSCLELDA